MFGQLMDNSIEGIVRWLNDFYREYLDHDHDKLNSKEVASASSSSSSSNYAMGTFTQTNETDKSVTGLGFTPTRLRIKAVNDSYTYGGFSLGTHDGTNDYCLHRLYHTVNGWITSMRSDYSIYCYKDQNNGRYGNVKSLDTDGFTIEWGKDGTPSDTKIIWEAYG